MAVQIFMRNMQNLCTLLPTCKQICSVLFGQEKARERGRREKKEGGRSAGK